MEYFQQSLFADFMFNDPRYSFVWERFVRARKRKKERKNTADVCSFQPYR